MPRALKLVIESPSMVSVAPRTTRPLTSSDAAPALAPSSWTVMMALSAAPGAFVLVAAPGWVYPLMTVELAERAGRGLVSAILQTATGVALMVVGLQPGSVDGILKAMVSPAPSLFAWLIAHRSEYVLDEHVARSAVVLMVRVASAA